MIYEIENLERARQFLGVASEKRQRNTSFKCTIPLLQATTLSMFIFKLLYLRN